MLWVCLYFPGSVWASDEFYYGPACQWIRLRGEIVEEIRGKGVLLTVYYRFEDQKAPANLLVNVPLSGKSFNFVLAGFDGAIPGALFVPPQFFFAKEIEFTYYAKTRDGSWSSAWKKTHYRPQRIKKDGLVLCQTGIDLKL